MKDQFRHCKPILGFEGAERLLKPGDIPHLLPNGNPDVGMIFEAYTEIAEASVERLVTRFVSVLRKHRILAREMDPPEI